jgi:hypothetical protein
VRVCVCDAMVGALTGTAVAFDLSVGDDESVAAGVWDIEEQFGTWVLDGGEADFVNTSFACVLPGGASSWEVSAEVGVAPAFYFVFVSEDDAEASEFDDGVANAVDSCYLGYVADTCVSDCTIQESGASIEYDGGRPVEAENVCQVRPALRASTLRPVVGSENPDGACDEAAHVSCYLVDSFGSCYVDCRLVVGAENTVEQPFGSLVFAGGGHV